MRVFVNDQPLHLAPGMTVKHALIQAGLLQDVQAGRRVVVDEWGHEMGLDGALAANVKLFVKERGARHGGD